MKPSFRRSAQNASQGEIHRVVRVWEQAFAKRETVSEPFENLTKGSYPVKPGSKR
jgi:hypothetical protein